MPPTMFSPKDLVWVQKAKAAKKVYWPATVEDASPKNFSVRYVNGKNRRRSLPDEVVPFTSLVWPEEDQLYKDADLAEAVKTALKEDTKRTKQPKVSLDRSEIEKFLTPDGTYIVDEAEADGIEVGNAEADSKWRKGFLDSLSDSDDEDVKSKIKAESDNDDDWTPMGDKPKKRFKDFFRFKTNVKQEEEEDEEDAANDQENQPSGLKVVTSKPNKDKKSELKALQHSNMVNRAAMFAKLREEMNKFKRTAVPQSAPKPKRIYARRPLGQIPYSNRDEPVRTRKRARLNSDGSSNENSEASTPKKRRYFDGLGYENVETEEYLVQQEAKKRRVYKVCPTRWAQDPNMKILTPEEVTDEMLANVADRVSEKVYDSKHGTTCHQCRQKTADVKTICRSGHCQGVRGMFCGVCLLNRYGQDCRAALKDPNWCCPPCMDVCNCSICRNRLGKGATGPITWLAQEKGFSNVKDYLDSLAKRLGSDEFDED